MPAFCQFPLLCSIKRKWGWKMKTGLYGLGFSIDLRHHVSTVIPAHTYPVKPSIHQPMSHSPYLPLSMLPFSCLVGITTISAELLLLLFKTFPRKDAIPTRQLLINAFVLFLLNATFLGSLCVTGSPAQVHDWGFTLVPHNCTTLAQFSLWKLQLSCEKVCKWEDIEAMQGRSSINYQKCWGDNTQQLKEENTLQGCKILRRNRVTSQWHQGPSHFQGGTTRLMTAWPVQAHQE